MSVYLRKVDTGDCRLLYEWRNDPVVRQNSFHQESIPWGAHCGWFQRMMQDPDQMQYIVMYRPEPYGEALAAGQVRISRAEEEEAANKAPVWEISYSIASSFRGIGLGTAAIRKLEEQIRADHLPVAILLARVKPDNLASRRVFEHAGFRQQQLTREYVEYIGDITT